MESIKEFIPYIYLEDKKYNNLGLLSYHVIVIRFGDYPTDLDITIEDNLNFDPYDSRILFSTYNMTIGYGSCIKHSSEFNIKDIRKQLFSALAKIYNFPYYVGLFSFLKRNKMMRETTERKILKTLRIIDYEADE
jgi:hypothetical protein